MLHESATPWGLDTTTAGRRGDPKDLTSSDPSHCPSQGVGQARGEVQGAAPGPGIMNLHKQGSSLGWDINLEMGVRIMYSERNWGQTQPHDCWAEPRELARTISP